MLNGLRDRDASRRGSAIVLKLARDPSSHIDVAQSIEWRGGMGRWWGIVGAAIWILAAGMAGGKLRADTP
jgi:hypothetical protein